MSFFELDGGAKKRKSTKPKATKKSSGTKKTTSGKKKTKKGGNFLGTVSELFAPAGWENFVTAAGLLALDRTDNYIRKSKDSKKQRGGADDATTPKTDTTPKMEEMESFTSRMSGGARKRSSSRKHRGGAGDTPNEEYEQEQFTSRMSGGARKRSSSRKQRGGSDGHHTVEYLDAVSNDVVDGEADMTPDTTSQTGGGKKRLKSKHKPKPKSKPKSKGKVRKQKGGMTDEEKVNFLKEYSQKSTQNEKNAFLLQYKENLEAMGLVNAYNAINKNSFPYNSESNRNTQIIMKAIQNQQSTLSSGNNSLTGTIFNDSNTEKALQNANNQGVQSPTSMQQSLFPNTGGKPKSKSKSKPKAKSSTKKPKAKKTKGRK